MGELISVQVGQCGNQVGSSFWSMIAREHAVGLDGFVVDSDEAHGGLFQERIEKVGVYFNEGSSGRYVPRSVLVDLEPGAIHSILGSGIGSLYRPDNCVFARSGAGNSWAKGHYTDGADLADQVMDVLRREAEKCSSLQGFQLCHSLGGGTGSGMGTLLLEKLKEEFPDRLLSTFSVFPSPKTSHIVVEPYNSILSINSLLETTDMCFALDNEALYDICFRYQKLRSPRYSDLNKLISRVMSGITCSFRFPGQLNSSLRKLAVNLIPFPRMHFFMVSHAPIVSPSMANYASLSESSITSALFSPHSMMAAADPRSGRYLAACALYRGASISSSAVECSLDDLRNKHSSHFCEFIPNSISHSVCRVPPSSCTVDGIDEEPSISATFVGNSTAMRSVYSRMYNQFEAMLRRKAFLHPYTEDGMDEMEFHEAGSNVLDLISECGFATSYDGDDDDDDDDDDLYLLQEEDVDVGGQSDGEVRPERERSVDLDGW